MDTFDAALKSISCNSNGNRMSLDSPAVARVLFAILVARLGGEINISQSDLDSVAGLILIQTNEGGTNNLMNFKVVNVSTSH